MDKEYIREQIVLLLEGEKTDISEDVIRNEMSKDPELKREYEEISALVGAAQKTCPEVTAVQWAKFMDGLHEKLESRQKGGVLIKLVEFFKSPMRAAAASIAAILVIALLLLFFNRASKIEIVVDEPVKEYELEYVSIEVIDNIEQIDQSFDIAENLIPSYEELTFIENIYAEFRARKENAVYDTIGSDEIELEELRRYYNLSENEDLS